MKTNKTSHVTLDEFKTAFASLPRGETFTYATGLVMACRRSGDDGILEIVASEAWHQYIKGRALLTQRRINPGSCDYHITKCVR